MNSFSKPYVIINSAITLDGKITSISNDSKISSKQDLKRLHKLRSQVDAILVGINTVINDDPILNIRLIDNFKKNPTRIILDSKCRIPLYSKIMKTAKKINTILVVTEKASKNNILAVEKLGAQVLHTKSKSNINIKKLFSVLKKLGFQKILVEGGGEINWSCFKSGIVNELILTISPRIIGGRNAITFVEGTGYSLIHNGISLKLYKIKKHSNDELVLYYKL
ncbi:MAG: 2,5-diamino-6-(ribosylamino)-4(3H)-pyrimidinone 5'-phosphate reductase [Nitrososphaeraceae archaeon]